MIELYPYQSEMIDQIKKKWNGGVKSLAVQLSTGGGKTVIFSYIAQQSAKKGSSILVVTHREELMSQTSGTLVDFGLTPTLIKGMNPPKANNLYVAMTKTLANRLCRPEWDEWYKKIDLVILDEMHLCEMDYIFDSYLTKSKWVLGFTATPSRKGHQKQLSSMYEDMVLGPDTQQLINMGYLVKDKYFSVPVDMNGVHKKGGEYDTSEMYDKYNQVKLYSGVVDNWKRICPEAITIVFCVNIQHAINTCKAFNDAGVTAKYLVSEVKKTNINHKQEEYKNYIDTFAIHSGERKKIIHDFKEGKFKVLINAGILTAGFDHKPINCVIMNRATTSDNLMLQIFGRASRISEKKDFFYILDFGENCKRLGYYRQQREWSLTHEETSKSDDGVAAVKTCPKCGALVTVSSNVCKYCGYVFPKTREQEVVELKEVSYSEAKKELKTIKDWEVYCNSKGYNKHWLFRQIYFNFGKEGLMQYAVTHHLQPSWVYITISRFKAKGD